MASDRLEDDTVHATHAETAGIVFTAIARLQKAVARLQREGVPATARARQLAREASDLAAPLPAYCDAAIAELERDVLAANKHRELRAFARTVDDVAGKIEAALRPSSSPVLQ